MQVLLVRHAAAEERDAARYPDDTQRPLTKGGARRFGTMLRTMRSSMPTIDRLLSSRYARAWQTAEIVARRLGCGDPVRCHAMEEQGVGAMFDALREHAIDDVGCVALVGHEPHISAFAATLIAGQSAAALNMRVRKGTIIALRFDDHIVAGAAVLEWMIAPRVVGG